MRIQDPSVDVSPPTASPARLTAYLAMSVGSSILATADVEAAVVSINLANVNGQDITGPSAGLTFNNGNNLSGAKVISNWLGAGTGNLTLLWNQEYIGLVGSNGLRIAALAGQPRSFASGASIGPTASFSPNKYSQVFGYRPYSTWYTAPNFGANTFLGFQFGSGSTFYYGYIEATWTFGGTGSTSSFQLYSAAYESTVNTAIVAGGTPVPAPSALALLALGGGAFRRARQRAA